MSRKIFNILTKELIQKAKEVKSAEELKAIAKENGVELSDEQAADMFSKLNTSGELADDEPDAVVGGGYCTQSDEKCPNCGELMYNSVIEFYRYCEKCGHKEVY